MDDIATDPNEQPSIGAIKARKPWTAANLSLLLAGLGQIYCGAFQRGIIWMCAASVPVIIGMLALATEISGGAGVFIASGIAVLGVAIAAAIDAYKVARHTREDYRLKEYNRCGIYAALIFLFAATIIGYAFIIRANFLHAFVMGSGSMSPTFEKGDRILVRKDIYRGRDPERGELVTFLNPENRHQTYVKRVIALGGETIELRKGVLHLNGEAVDEAANVQPDENDFGPFEVPLHHCFVLGDNRAISRDSRYFGPVPLIGLVGKVIFAR